MFAWRKNTCLWLGLSLVGAMGARAHAQSRLISPRQLLALENTAPAAAERAWDTWLLAIARRLQSASLGQAYELEQRLMAPRFTLEDERRAEERLARLDGRWLAALTRDLRGVLVASPWRDWLAQPLPRVEAWGAEWNALLGRAAPAAAAGIGAPRGTSRDAGRIAIRPHRFAPTVLRIFLFHELSHFRAHGPAAAPEAAELAAWQETLRFSAWLAARAGEPEPMPFAAIRASVGAMGLAAWVRAVVNSRPEPLLMRDW